MKRVILDINHPAHVHFFKNLYWTLISDGYEVLCIASKKPLVYELLESYSIPYKKLGSYGKTLYNKVINLLRLDLKFLRLALVFKPDIILGIGSFRGAHIGWLLNKTSLIFTDTDNAKLQIYLFRYFATRIYTPLNFKLKLGNSHIRYEGFHELAYLHPHYFHPDKKVLEHLNVRRGDIFVLIRFVAWDATHDRGKGITDANKIRAVKEFSKFGRVFITSEAQVPIALQEYLIKIPPILIHSAINFSALVFGESATMASEAAVLGVPSIFIDDFGRCYTDELQERYGIVYNFKQDEKSQSAAIRQGVKILSKRHDYTNIRKRILQEKIDTTQMMIDEIEKL